MKTELNDRFLKSLKAPETGRVEVSDSKRPGLRFRLYPSSKLHPKGKAVWMYEKRIKGGPKRKHTFGTYPAPIGLAEARALSLEIEAEAAKGIDRIANDKAANIATEISQASRVTVKDVLDAYDELHLSTLRTREERKRQLMQSLSKHIAKSISELTRKDIQAAVDEKARLGRKPYANRIRAALVAFTKWAWTRNYLETDIGAGIAKATKETVRERTPSISEIQSIWATTYMTGELWGPLFRVMLLTAQRRGEIMQLRFSEIDFHASKIVKPGARTKNGKPHTTHLSPPALAELRRLVRPAGHEFAKCDFVFTTTGSTPVSGIGKAKAALDKALGDEFVPWRLHDIRTGFATAMAEAGVSETIADRVLNHSASGSAPSTVARVYNQAEQLPQRAAALDKWADMVTDESAAVYRLEAR